MMYVVCTLICLGFAGSLTVLLFSDKGRRSLVLALRSLYLHKLRAFLSVLGIIIGTLAVISLMGVGEGSMQDALEDIKRQARQISSFAASSRPMTPRVPPAESPFMASPGPTTND